MPAASSGGAGAGELPVHLDHAGVAGLDRAELGMITDVTELGVPAQQEIDEKFACLCFNGLPVQCQFDCHKQSPAN